MSLPSGYVSLEDYREAWPGLFRQERDRLLGAIGHVSKSIEHVGSTAVPGLCAKPVIDIAVGVATLAAGERCIGPLQQIGYEYKGEAGIPGRHFFAKGSVEGRTHYVHVEPLNGALWRNHILFRDYLRSHREAVSSYGQLKRELASQYANDRDAYAAGKNAYIDETIVTASEMYDLDEVGRTRSRR